MLRRRFGTFTGGIDIPDDKEATLDAPIAPVGRLERLRVPLAPVPAEPARPVVRPGYRVADGQKLAEADSPEQVAVFAPLAGRVARFTEALVPAHPSGWRVSPAIELTDLGRPEGIRPLPTTYQWQAADDGSLRLRVAEGGLVTSGSPPTALAGWVEAARRAKVHTLIANVMENTPFVTADHRLLAEHGGEVMRGLVILARAIGVTEAMLAVDLRRTGAYQAAVGPAHLHGVDAIALAHKYPIGAEPILVKVLTRREIPLGRRAFSIGVATTDAATCWATYQWVACGVRPTARVVTVAGPRVGAPGNLLVPFGADAGEVLALAEVRGDEPAIHGPAMTGRMLPPEAVVTGQTNALLALEPPPAGVPTPCIRCGWCTDNCPARLNVAALNDDFELGRTERARRRGALACVGCGICSYVCPARLPLARRVGLLMQAIREEQTAAPARASQ